MSNQYIYLLACRILGPSFPLHQNGVFRTFSCSVTGGILTLKKFKVSIILRCIWSSPYLIIIIYISILFKSKNNLNDHSFKMCKTVLKVCSMFQDKFEATIWKFIYRVLGQEFSLEFALRGVRHQEVPYDLFYWPMTPFNLIQVHVAKVFHVSVPLHYSVKTLTSCQ